MIKKKEFSVQKWLPFDEIYEDGNIRLKNRQYVKIIKVFPTNFNLKSNLEKEVILNSYKAFLKSCNFNIQILIQSKKEDLTKHISKIKEKTTSEKLEIKNIAEKYNKYILETNQKRKSSSKNFFIIINENPEKRKIETNEENIHLEKLNEKYLIIKDALSRCGNAVYEVENREEVEKILYSFLNTRKEINI